VFRF